MALENPTQYVDQKVILVKSQGEGKEAVEIEGTVLSANDLGVLLKPKGKTQADLIEAASIVEVRFAPKKEESVKVRTVQPVKFGQGKQHLAERHGLSVKGLNSKPEEEAFNYHASLDHADLGHKHEEKKDPAATPTEGTEETATSES